MRIRDLPRFEQEYPFYRELIEDQGWAPYLLADSIGVYWSGFKVRQRDGRVFDGISDPAKKQIIRMIQSGEFGEQARDVILDPQRYDRIYDNLIQFHDEEAVERESLRVLEISSPNRVEPTASRQSAIDDAIDQPGPTTGPRPSSWTGIVSRDATQASFTYAFQLGNRDLWKIGHATDVRARLTEINKHVPHEVIGEQWRLALQQEWATEVDAYNMEQRVLEALRTSTSVAERVACSRQRLERTWKSVVIPKRR